MTPSLNPNQKPVVFITGASSGIGSGLAKHYLLNGYAVAITARRFSLLEELAQSWAHLGPVLPIACDITQHHSVLEAVKQCETLLGPIQIGIANAGISESTVGGKLDIAQIERVMATNFLGVIYTFQAITLSMKPRKNGQLVAISSLAGFRGLPGASAYCASKAAVSAFTESLRMDLAPYGILVQLIQPGWIKTPLTDRNRYAMPFILPFENGVLRIFKAIQTRKKVMAFPFPLSTIVKLLRFFPPVLYDAVLGKRKNIKE